MANRSYRLSSKAITVGLPPPTRVETVVHGSLVRAATGLVLKAANPAPDPMLLDGRRRSIRRWIQRAVGSRRRGSVRHDRQRVRAGLHHDHVSGSEGDGHRGVRDDLSEGDEPDPAAVMVSATICR